MATGTFGWDIPPCEGTEYTAHSVLAVYGCGQQSTFNMHSLPLLIQPRLLPPDLDEDCDVDQDDYTEFQDCATGPEIPQLDTECLRADFDGDSEVEQEDFGFLQQCFAGADVPADPACMASYPLVLQVDAGPDRVAAPNMTLSLPGTVFGGEGPYQYDWVLIASGDTGSVTLTNADTQTASAEFSSDASGTFTFQVTVTDSAGTPASDTDLVDIALGMGLVPVPPPPPTP
jgi:hypothetical protein